MPRWVPDHTHAFYGQSSEDGQHRAQDEAHPAEDVKHDLHLKRNRIHQSKYDGKPWEQKGSEQSSPRTLLFVSDN